jgi:hypothetical protein
MGRPNSCGGRVSLIAYSKQSSTPLNLDLHREQLAACSTHSVALYISQISGMGVALRVGALLCRRASEGAGVGGRPVQLKISAEHYTRHPLEYSSHSIEMGFPSPPGAPLARTPVRKSGSLPEN